MRIHGSSGQVMLDPTGGALAVAVVSLNASTLDMARDKVDVTAFLDTNKQYVQGLPDIKGTIGGWYDSEALEIFDVAQGDIAAMLKLVPDSREATNFWTGLAFLDASVNVSATGAVSIASNFVGAGPWTREPAGVVLGRSRRGELPRGESEPAILQ
jgi:hypothetical protein